MAVTVSGKNYTQITNCESTANWVSVTPAIDSGNYMEGSGSASFNARQTSVTWSYTYSIDLSGVKHLRVWYLCTTAGLLLSKASGGFRMGVSGGGNTGYWNLTGSDEYQGGWINLAVDVSRAVDSGTKPTDMSAVTSIFFQQNMSDSGKNTENTWLDNLCVGDGLIAYGDDAGGYFDFEDIFQGDAGKGFITKYNGQYFVVGSLTLGDSVSTNGCKFQAKSQIVTFEDRPVNSALYAIDVVDNGTGVTEFILGDKSGTAGIQGCNIRVESISQAAKFSLDGSTDTDVDNFKLYASSFYGGNTITFPSAAANVEILGSSFELCGQVVPDDASVEGCFFINTSDSDAAVLWNESIDLTESSFIANTTGAGIEMPSSVGSPYAYSGLLFSGNTYDVLNSSGSAIIINKNDGSNPTTYEGSTVNFLGTTVTTQITVKDLSTGSVIDGARVLVWVTDGTNFPYQDVVTITGTGTTATVSHTDHGLVTGDNVIIEDASPDVYNGAYSITYISDSSYSYTTSETIVTSPATGTIHSTFAFINEDTNASGIANDTRIVNTDQGVLGWARKSTSSPYYQQGVITGTVDNENGLTLTIQLVRDE